MVLFVQCDAGLHQLRIQCASMQNILKVVRSGGIFDDRLILVIT